MIKISLINLVIVLLTIVATGTFQPAYAVAFFDVGTIWTNYYVFAEYTSGGIYVGPPGFLAGVSCDAYTYGVSGNPAVLMWEAFNYAPFGSTDLVSAPHNSVMGLYSLAVYDSNGPTRGEEQVDITITQSLLSEGAVDLDGITLGTYLGGGWGYDPSGAA